MAGRGWFVWLHWRGFGIRSDRGFGDRNFKLSEGDQPEFLKFQPKSRDDRRKHAADKQTAPDPTHTKTGASCLYSGYADVALVTSSGLKMVLVWRKKALRPGPVFSLLSLFADSADAFAEISKTRPVGLKQFEIFRLRHRLNFPAKILNVASKTRPHPSGFLGNQARVR